MCRLHRVEMAPLSLETLIRMNTFICPYWPPARVALIRRIQGPCEEINPLERC